MLEGSNSIPDRVYSGSAQSVADATLLEYKAMEAAKSVPEINAFLKKYVTANFYQKQQLERLLSGLTGLLD